MKIRIFVLFALLVLMVACEKTPPPAALVAPKDFKLVVSNFVGVASDNYKCDFPAPYTGQLNFPSKFDGSGKSRDTLNEEANKQYKALIEPIDTYAKKIASLAKRLHKKPNKQDAICLYHGLVLWAEQDALTDDKANGTGKAIRKWTLATLASHYLALKDIGVVEQEQEKLIEHWFSELAQLVKKDYSDRPIEKVNNHDYWASWSVILVAIILDDRELYSWSLDVLKTALMQVDNQGLLPNELKRASRAFSYHNFAMLPLATTAAFAFVNGDDVTAINQQALYRMAGKILQPKASEFFTSVTGVKQASFKLKEKGHLSWIPALLSISGNDADWTHNIRRHEIFRQHGYSRLGGQACQRFTCPLI